MTEVNVRRVREIAHSTESVTERIRQLNDLAWMARAELNSDNLHRIDSDRAYNAQIEAEVAIEELREDGFCTEVVANV